MDSKLTVKRVDQKNFYLLKNRQENLQVLFTGIYIIHGRINESLCLLLFYIIVFLFEAYYYLITHNNISEFFFFKTK